MAMCGSVAHLAATGGNGMRPTGERIAVLTENMYQEMELWVGSKHPRRSIWFVKRFLTASSSPAMIPFITVVNINRE